MVEVRIEDANVVFEVQGWDKLWALSSRLSIPISHIKAAHREPQAEMGWFDGFKLMGANVPDLFRAGTFLQHGELVFWDVRERERAIMVELEHERFKKLIVEVANPDQTVTMIESAVSSLKG